MTNLHTLYEGLRTPWMHTYFWILASYEVFCFLNSSFSSSTKVPSDRFIPSPSSDMIMDGTAIAMAMFPFSLQAALLLHSSMASQLSCSELGSVVIPPSLPLSLSLWLSPLSPLSTPTAQFWFAEGSLPESGTEISQEEVDQGVLATLGTLPMLEEEVTLS